MMDTETSIAVTVASLAVSKVVDTVGHGIGVWYEPTRLRREAQAEIDVAKIKLKGAFELAELEAGLRERLQGRLLHQEIRRQQNIDAIVQSAINQAPDDVNDVKPDPDWTVAFFAECEDVSDADMQAFWGRLLADEVAQPGSFSRRTLSVLRTLSPADARLFRRLCSHAWLIDDSVVGIAVSNDGGVSRRFLEDLCGIGSREMYRLQDLGLAKYTSTEFTIASEPTRWAYIGADYFSTNSKMRGIRQSFRFTLEGSELYRIATPDANDQYRRATIDFAKSQGFVFGKEPVE